MAYLYETHLHTSRSSGCASARGRDYIKYYLDAGYTGIFVTDHFFRGNCTVRRSLPWKEWVQEFCRGFEETREEGARRGLDVFFGWEETFDGDDYLIYGLDREWLLEHPEAKDWSRKTQCRVVREAGGCVIQAHPFRQHYYIRAVTLAPEFVDGVEAANAGNQEQYYDALALRYAAKLGLPVTAGSDIHHLEQAKAGEFYGVYLDRKLEGAAGFAALIRGGFPRGPESLKIDAGRCESRGDEAIDIPLEILDGNERAARTDFWDFMERG
ncbi:MAG: PHP domain-containing protein [Treponema sp.]|jgi:predicted metal-dependent phosphoesterase TrpH|nr:PHP domain-containing protein [Treponema sp.]